MDNGDQDGDGYVSILYGGDDCDDTDPNRYPGNAEVCDSHDEDCDLSTLGEDIDRDGYYGEFCCNPDPDDPTMDRCGNDCDDLNPSISPFATEVCNGVDENCDGKIDIDFQQFEDLDKDGHGSDIVRNGICAGTEGYSGLSNDCDDGNPAIKPGVMVCVGSDQIQICNSDGEYDDPVDCIDECVSQPNGTGYCQQSKVKKVK